jgi:hypothetical protein
MKKFRVPAVVVGWAKEILDGFNQEPSSLQPTKSVQLARSWRFTATKDSPHTALDFVRIHSQFNAVCCKPEGSNDVQPTR